jgi:hypothetical protein
MLPKCLQRIATPNVPLLQTMEVDERSWNPTNSARNEVDKEDAADVIEMSDLPQQETEVDKKKLAGCSILTECSHRHSNFHRLA